MSESAKAIFLSYASQDSESARRICEALRAAGLEVWFDQNELRGGEAWDASIRRQIRECALFVPVISASTQAREEGYFRREWNLAANRTLDMADDRAFLLPVVIDDTVNGTARVPDRFREVQWTRLLDGLTTQSFIERVQRLLMTSGAGSASVTFGPAAIASPGALSPPTAQTRAAPSIAVLPFVNLSRDEENEYFADGLAEELLSVIAKIRGLRVAARTSSFSFKGKAVEIHTIAAKLNVATVLEGSVRKAGKRVRVSAQLINAADGYHLWSETYDRELDDIFSVQDDIAQAVVRELQASLLAPANSDIVNAEVKAASKGRTVNAAAHRLRMQGKHLFRMGSTKARETAIDYFRRALAIDPNFSGAWADFAHALYWRTAAGGAELAITDYLAGFHEAKAAAGRAIDLEPDLPEAHVAMAYIQGSIDWNMEHSERSIRRAVLLAPGDGDIAYHGAIHMMVRGHSDEASQLSERAIELDPLNPNGYVMLGRAKYCIGQLAEAEAALLKALEMNAGGYWARGLLIQVLLAQHRIDEASDRADALQEPEYRHLNRVMVYWAKGIGDESNRLMRELIDKYSVFFAYQIAQAHAFRGEIDGAFAWLDRCHEQHDPGAHWTMVDPAFIALRTDTRWPGLMEKLGYGYLAVRTA